MADSNEPVEPRADARPEARLAGGFRDLTAADLDARHKMLETVRKVYELHGFEPLETPAIEYVESLGKFLPEAHDQPDAGVFSFQADYGEWVALRYDLTAPLARYFAQNHQTLPRPFRRFQIGPVWRVEKWGPGRFREFTQCDFDTVGTSSIAADGEVCMVLSNTLEALGVPRGDYIVRVNNRKILNGLLESLGLGRDWNERAGAVLRAMDKRDRLGDAGVRELLGKGRLDPSGHFMPGAGLEPAQAEKVLTFLGSGGIADRAVTCDLMQEMVGESAVGREGVDELRAMHELLDIAGIGADRVMFEPGVVRGLEYYTGPVFEVELTFQVPDEKGRMRTYGAVAAGGRYDGLVERFTGEKVPATGASIGVDRLLDALQRLGRVPTTYNGPVVITVMSKRRMPLYQEMVAELRAAGIRAELYLGDAGFKAQLRYADRRSSPLAVIAGGEEFDRGVVQVKDLRLGKELSGQIEDREQWTKERPAQVEVPRKELVAAIRRGLAGSLGETA